LQIFNNWSPYLVSDPDKVWVGVEYFCYEGDELWRKPDEEMKTFAAEELARIGIIDPGDVLDATVIHMPKTYPAYFGTYDRFRRDPRVRGRLFQPFPGWPQRHAQVQQSGSFHAHGDDRGG
jgi:protoporphyrinogen oxidase